MQLLVPFLVIFILIFLNGVFVAAEFAAVGIRPSRLEQLAEEGNRTAARLRKILTDPARADRYIATAQLGITLASLGLGMVGEPFLAHLIEEPLHAWFGLEGDIVHTISFLIGLLIITYLHVVLGEMVPKSLALQNAERTILALAGIMNIMQSIFGFAITGLNKIGLFVLRLLNVPPPSEGSRLHTPDELELIVSESVVAGLMQAEEQTLVQNIFDFRDRRVGQSMTPRVHIEAIPVNITESELLEEVFQSPHSRFPVYDGNIDNIIGVLHLKDLVHQQLEKRPFDLRKMLRKAPEVPETMYAESLLATMKRQHVHMAIVLDEYGGTAGIVTLEDLIEEVVGEVRDEFDVNEVPPLTVVEPGHLVVRGNIPLEDLEDYVELGEHEYDVESVGGLVMAELNRPPAVGDEVEVNDIVFRVESVDGLSIERVAVYFEPEEDETSESAEH